MNADQVVATSNLVFEHMRRRIDLDVQARHKATRTAVLSGDSVRLSCTGVSATAGLDRRPGAYEHDLA